MSKDRLVISFDQSWFEWHFGFVAGFKVRGVVGYASARAGRGDCHRKGRAVHQGREVREVYENRVRHGADGAHFEIVIFARVFR